MSGIPDGGAIVRDGHDFRDLRCPKCGAPVERPGFMDEGHSEDDEEDVECKCGAVLEVRCSQIVFSYRVRMIEVEDAES